MGDFLVAVGLVFVLEGLMFAAMPTLAKRAMTNAVETPDATLRLIGIFSAIIGVAAVWLVRG
jgi:uncharacterized protein YjeT (DUF2065 family)